MAKAPIKFKMTVESWKPDLDALAEHLAADKGVHAITGKVAEDVMVQATINMGTSPISPPGAKYDQFHKATKKQRGDKGHHWSLAPRAVATMIGVKDVVNWKKGRKGAAADIAVALVVSDHPGSLTYERGGFGISATKFMSSAAKRVAGSKTWLGGKRNLGRQ